MLLDLIQDKKTLQISYWGEGGKTFIDTVEIKDEDLEFVDITISSITMATLEGNSYYYIEDENGNRYKVSLVVSDELPFLEVGDVIKGGYITKTDVTELLTLK
jgi:hypothetical protein